MLKKLFISSGQNLEIAIGFLKMQINVICATRFSASEKQNVVAFLQLDFSWIFNDSSSASPLGIVKNFLSIQPNVGIIVMRRVYFGSASRLRLDDDKTIPFDITQITFPMAGRHIFIIIGIDFYDIPLQITTIFGKLD